MSVSSSKIDFTRRIKGPPGLMMPQDSSSSSAAAVASGASPVAGGKVTFQMTVESIAYVEPKEEDDDPFNSANVAAASASNGEANEKSDAFTSYPKGMFKNTVEIRADSSLCDPADALELNALKRELDFYKLHTQVLLQTKTLLEEKLTSVTNDFEDFKESLKRNPDDDVWSPPQRSANSSIPSSRKSSAIIAESPEEDLGSISPLSSSRKNSGFRRRSSSKASISAFQSAVENIFGVSEEFRNSPASSARGSAASAPPSRTVSTYQLPSRPSHLLNRPHSNESFYSIRSDPAVGDESPVSAEQCRHFLKGRCRYKRLCKFSHEVAICPYCSIELPQAKIAASTHLSRCYKANGKNAANSGSFDDDFQDLDGDGDQDEEDFPQFQNALY